MQEEANHQQPLQHKAAAATQIQAVFRGCAARKQRRHKLSLLDPRRDLSRAADRESGQKPGWDLSRDSDVENEGELESQINEKASNSAETGNELASRKFLESALLNQHAHAARRIQRSFRHSSLYKLHFNKPTQTKASTCEQECLRPCEEKLGSVEAFRGSLPHSSSSLPTSPAHGPTVSSQSQVAATPPQRKTSGVRGRHSDKTSPRPAGPFSPSGNQAKQQVSTSSPSSMHGRSSPLRPNSSTSSPVPSKTTSPAKSRPSQRHT